MTASQVATKAGLARPTVSTTLSKLAKTGEVQKADRGYRLPAAGSKRTCHRAARPPDSCSVSLAAEPLGSSGPDQARRSYAAFRREQERHPPGL